MFECMILVFERITQNHEHFSSREDYNYRMRQHSTFADGTIIVASAISLRK